MRNNVSDYDAILPSVYLLALFRCVDIHALEVFP